MAGIKPVENRSWRTAYRGRIGIHAGLKAPQMPPNALIAGLCSQLPDPPPRGLLLGTVDLVDIRDDYPSVWAIKGQWHWVVRDPEQLAEPLALRGQMGLWTVELPAGYGLAESDGP
jgi:hypothetical protein